MRKALSIAMRASLALIGAGCHQSFPVETMAAPDASFSGLSTFRVLPVPSPRDGRARSDAYDPMMNNSIANRALRETITATLIGRGYVQTDDTPDFEVAVYASAHDKLDVSLWDYGYPYWPRRGWWYPPPRTVTEYTEGTVVVDFVRPRLKELFWRGSASARLSRHPARDVKELQKVAAAVVKKFPPASQRPVAVVP